MSRNTIKNNLIEAKQILDQFLANEETLDNIEKAAQMMIKSIQAGGKIISCGNGGSMCDAMHFAEELTGRFRENRKPIAALSISDVSHITCVGNDYGFDEIFSRYIQGVGREGDVFLAISTSGNSRNIIRAAEEAKLKKMKIVALTGKDGGKLSNISDVEIRAPFSKYADRAQEIHIKVIHSLIQYIEENC